LSAITCTAGTASAGINAALGTPGPATIALQTLMLLEGGSSGCICGNNIVECAEHCDDGNAVDDDGCDSNCTATGCPNGIVTSGEECDDGDNLNGDGCDNNCTVSACGNGATGFGEACDDGNLNDADGCDSNCTFTACGNGVTTASTGEECDDGNLDDGDGCSSGCLTEPPDPCLVVPTCIGRGANGRASISIGNDDAVGKDKLTWKWTNGDESLPDDFGDPSSTVSYRLCIIDSGAVAESYDVAPSNTLWSLGSNDIKYRDKAGSSDGITQIKLRPGSDGRARIGLQARGPNFVAPTAFSPGQMFHQAPNVTIRLVNSLGRCWESDFPVLSATRNSAERFQAKVP
jgi:cysteine-rich repeat protein